MLKRRLINLVNVRIQNGDFTERGLARILGISQSQAHNVLKGARRLKPELADHLMWRLNMSVLDLLEPLELQDQALFLREVSDRLPNHCTESIAHVPVAKLEELRKRPKSSEAPKPPSRLP